MRLHSKNIYYLTGVIFILNVSLLGCNFNQENRNLGQQNAIWAESIYLRGQQPSTLAKLTSKQVDDYAKLLKRNNVKYVYLFAGPFQKDGHLPEYPFSISARNNVKQLVDINPQLVILPWVGGVHNSTVKIMDSTWIQNALNDTKKLVDFLGVPGVHVDLEFILPGNRYLDTTIEAEKEGERDSYAAAVNHFHKQLRLKLPNAFISSVVACTSVEAKQWKRKTSLSELKDLIKYIDQISFLFYDTSIKTQAIFETACINQLKTIKELRSHNDKLQYLIAVGTFVNRAELQEYRDLNIENVPNTLQTIKNSLKTLGHLNGIDGIAIFCDWETDTYEWTQIRNNWTGI